MDEFKLCSDGVFMPADLPCPPPYSGPYYYYPYENTPSPPSSGGSTNTASSTSATSSIHQGASSSLSAGSVAGIMVMASCLFAVIFALAIKFRARFITGFLPSRRRNHGRVQQNGDGDQQLDGNDVAVNVMSGHAGGLGEKLVSLLPVSEYVSDHAINVEGKQDLDAKQRSSTTECAVCLSFFEERDIVRVLPKCHHTFHICCIDKWFESHVNCPLCRERITLQTIQLSLDAVPAGPEEDEQTMDEQQEPIIIESEQLCQYGESALSNITSNNTQGHIGPAAYQGLTHEEDEESKKELEEEEEEEKQQHVSEAAGPSVCGSHLVWIKGAYKSMRDSKVERLPYPQCTEDDGTGRCGRGNNNKNNNNNEGDIITMEGSSRMLRKSRSMGSMITHHLDCFTATSAAQASKYLSGKV